MKMHVMSHVQVCSLSTCYILLAELGELVEVRILDCIEYKTLCCS